MEDESYKVHEDNQQETFLSDAIEEGNGFYCYTTLTSCKYLSRRFIHSANAYFYQCHSDIEMDGCPKLENQGVADVACFTTPFAFEMGEDNNEQGEFNGK